MTSPTPPSSRNYGEGVPAMLLSTGLFAVGVYYLALAIATYTGMAYMGSGGASAITIGSFSYWYHLACACAAASLVIYFEADRAVLLPFGVQVAATAGVALAAAAASAALGGRFKDRYWDVYALTFVGGPALSLVAGLLLGGYTVLTKD